MPDHPIKDLKLRRLRKRAWILLFEVSYSAESCLAYKDRLERYHRWWVGAAGLAGIVVGVPAVIISDETLSAVLKGIVASVPVFASMHFTKKRADKVAAVWSRWQRLQSRVQDMYNRGEDCRWVDENLWGEVALLQALQAETATEEDLQIPEEIRDNAHDAVLKRYGATDEQTEAGPPAATSAETPTSEASDPSGGANDAPSETGSSSSTSSEGRPPGVET